MRVFNQIGIALVLTVAVGCGGSGKKDTAKPKAPVAKNGKPAAQPSDQPTAQPSDQPAAKPTGNPATPQPKPADPVAATPVAGGTPAGGPQVKPVGIVRTAAAMVRKGQYESAIRQAKAALRRNEKYTPAMEVMARAYFHLGKTEFAAAICGIALSINSRSAKCHNMQGFVSMRSKDYGDAIAAFKKATNADPNFGPAWLNLGALYLRAKNYPAAVKALEQAVRLVRNRPETHLNLGAAYRGAGRLPQAQQALLHALKLRPQYADAFFNLGILYLDADPFPGMKTMKRLSKAVSYLNKYKQLSGSRNQDDPVDTYLKAADRAIRKEQRRIKREQRRKARAAAKKAKAAEAPKDEKKK